ncbi:hypothetical protein GHT09_008193 [Marmota monax]|uniref:PLAT domain-containing protein n=1 Tax=Marmota monax TaxID=9995 RepID=A0A834UM07_MARMO|nr:hypothetical protein GHT09_008193 [Marmota monax]
MLCAGWRYGVSVTLSGRTITGEVKVALFGDKGNTRQYDVFRGIIMPGSTHSKEFDAELDVGTTEKVKFLWNNHVVNPTFPRVGAAKITVQKGEEKTVYNFCSKETVKEDVLLTLTPCETPDTL